MVEVNDIPGSLLWGVPGLIVVAFGMLWILLAYAARHRRSASAVRLTTVGAGLATLGVTGGAVHAALAASAEPIALLLLAVLGWVPAAFLLIASGMPVDR